MSGGISCGFLVPGVGNGRAVYGIVRRVWTRLRGVSRLLLLNKPFGVLCQFSDRQGRPTLADFVSVPGVYPAGRLDADSEGLVALTDDGALQHRLTDPRHKLAKTYGVQVEGVPTREAIRSLQRGVPLADGPTRPARVRRIETPDLWERRPPIRVRREIPTRWLEIVLTEGRNRQLRRMSAAVGFPTLRLVRVAIGPLDLGRLGPGQWREVAVPDALAMPRSRGARRAVTLRAARRSSPA